MVAGIEQFYQIIADSIQEAVPEQWSTAWIDAFFFPDGISYSGEYLPKQGTASKSFATTSAGRRAFRDIRELFKASGQPLWGRAHFEINSAGNFKIDWGYDDCDENGFAIFDEEAELKRKRKRLDSQ